MVRSKEKIFQLAAVLILAAAATCINLYQTRQVTPLIDYTYSADAAYRIYRGEMPYRDFYLAYTPFTYYVIAGLMALTGGFNHMVQVYGTMMVSALTILLNFTLYRKITHTPWLSLVLTVPLLFSGHSIYPYPIYDIQIILVIQTVILLTVDFEAHPVRAASKGLLTGSLAALTALIKQNVGLVFVVVWMACILLVFLFNRSKSWQRFLLGAAAGIVLVFGCFLLFLYTSGALGNFYYQTILIPSQLRNPVTGLVKTYMELETYIKARKTDLAVVLGALLICPVLFSWLHSRRRETPETVQGKRTVQAVTAACFLLLAAGLTFTLLNRPIQQINIGIWLIIMIIAVVIGLMEAIKTMRRGGISFYGLIPGLCLVIFISASTSQGFTGSSYGMWPTFFLLFAWLLMWLKDHSSPFPWNQLTVCLCVFLTIFMGSSALSEIRMKSYIDLSGETHTSSIPALKGLTARGIWLPEFDNLIAYVNKTIPPTDDVAFFAGEDVFFEVTQRKNPNKCIFFVAETCDQTIGETLKALEAKKVKWIIIKSQYQYLFWPQYLIIREDMIPPSYRHVTDVGIYRIYQFK